MGELRGLVGCAMSVRERGESGGGDNQERERSCRSLHGIGEPAFLDHPVGKE